MLDEGPAHWQLEGQVNAAVVYLNKQHQGKSKEREQRNQLAYHIEESKNSNQLRQRLIGVERNDAIEAASISIKKLF